MGDAVQLDTLLQRYLCVLLFHNGIEKAQSFKPIFAGEPGHILYEPGCYP